MKTAKSLVYGGELIDAIDCTYADFERLAPLCPNCSNPVYLRAGGDRISTKGTEYKISQHWAHFKGKSAEEVAACELRVNGYSDADREQIQRAARGQREKWIQRWLWRALCEYSDRNIDFSVLGCSSTVTSVASLGFRSAKWFDFTRTTGSHKEIVEIIKGLNLDENHFKDLIHFINHPEETMPGLIPYVQVFGDSDLKLHRKIVEQIWRFLKNEKNRGLLEVFVESATVLHGQRGLILLTNAKTVFKRLSENERRQLCSAHLTQILCVFTPWASEFARLEAARKASQRECSR